MEIARLLRGQREALSVQERDEVLRHRISYYPTDAVIPTWSSALVYDTESGAPGVLEILEFVNSQLLEFRLLRSTARCRARQDLRGAPGGDLAPDLAEPSLQSRGEAYPLVVHRCERVDRPC